MHMKQIYMPLQDADTCTNALPKSLQICMPCARSSSCLIIYSLIRKVMISDTDYGTDLQSCIRRSDTNLLI